MSFFENGGRIGKLNAPSFGVANGIWNLQKQLLSKSDNKWPGILTSVSFITSSTSSTTTITIPATSQEGDIAILLDSAASTSAPLPTSVVPTDFTPIVDTGVVMTNAPRQIFSYKILNSLDPDSIITGMDGAFSDKKLIMIFRPVGKWITDVVLSTPSAQATDGNPTSQSITMSASSPVLIGMAGYRSSGNIDPRTATGATFSEISFDTTLYVKYCIFNQGDTPTNATVDMDDEGNNNILQSFFMRLL